MRTLKFYYYGADFNLHKPRQDLLPNENTIFAYGKRISVKKTEISNSVQLRTLTTLLQYSKLPPVATHFMTLGQE